LPPIEVAYSFLPSYHEVTRQSLAVKHADNYRTLAARPFGGVTSPELWALPSIDGGGASARYLLKIHPFSKELGSWIRNHDPFLSNNSRSMFFG
jgi:hypothetical protein